MKYRTPALEEVEVTVKADKIVMSTSAVCA